MNYIELYCKTIIQPLEKMRDEILDKHYSSIFFKSKYKLLLDKIDEELMNKYNKFDDMIEEEIKFQELLKDSVK